jgi:hypothetical protein
MKIWIIVISASGGIALFLMISDKYAQMKRSSTAGRLIVIFGISYAMLIFEDPTVTMKCRTAIGVLYLYSPFSIVKLFLFRMAFSRVLLFCCDVVYCRHSINKELYGCKRTWENMQLYTWTQINVKEQLVVIKG